MKSLAQIVFLVFTASLAQAQFPPASSCPLGQYEKCCESVADPIDLGLIGFNGLIGENCEPTSPETPCGMTEELVCCLFDETIPGFDEYTAGCAYDNAGV